MRLEFIPTQFIFGVLVGASNQIALWFSPGHLFQGNRFGCITQDTSELDSVFANEQPFAEQLMARINHRHPIVGKMGFQKTAFTDAPPLFKEIIWA